MNHDWLLDCHVTPFPRKRSTSKNECLQENGLNIERAAQKCTAFVTFLPSGLSLRNSHRSVSCQPRLPSVAFHALWLAKEWQPSGKTMSVPCVLTCFLKQTPILNGWQCGFFFSFLHSFVTCDQELSMHKAHKASAVCEVNCKFLLPTSNLYWSYTCYVIWDRAGQFCSCGANVRPKNITRSLNWSI